MNSKKYISEFDLLLIANNIIQEHDDYISDIRADSVIEKDGILIFKGDCFLDDLGLPSEQTPIIFNLFKYLTLHLSKEFTLNSKKP